MAELRTVFDDPRWPAAFVLAIVTITVATLLAQRARTKRRPRFGGSRAHRPWPAPGALALAAGPVRLVPPQPDTPPVAQPVAVPRQRGPLPEPEPAITVLLAIAPGGPVGAAAAARLLAFEPGVHVRIRRADVDPVALVAALPDDVAINLDDLTAAPTDSTRNHRFRRSVETSRPRLPCAVILTGRPGTPPVVAVTTIDLQLLVADDAWLAALFAVATAADAHPADRCAFDTALLAAARSRAVDSVLDLEGLRTESSWVRAHQYELRDRYGVLLGTQAAAS